MDYFVPAIDPLYALGRNVGVGKVRSKEDVQKEFVSMFLAQIMKDVFKAQSSMFGEEGALGTFSDNLYNDIFLAKVSRDMASSKAFGFDKLFPTNK